MSDSFSGQTVGLVPGRLRGYRAWKLDPVTGVLTGLTAQVAWPSERLDARCYRNMLVMVGLYSADPYVHLTEVPDPKCSCGVYALHDPQSLSRYAPIWPPETVVYGVVEGWGRTVIGDHGWRARHGQIAALVVPRMPELIATPLDDGLYTFTRVHPLARSVGQALAARYEVPIVDSLHDLIREYPPIGVQELLKNRDEVPR